MAEPEQKRYAFFDLDYTLLPHDSLLLFCNHILRKRPARIFYLLVFLPVTPLAALRLIGSGRLKRIFLSFLWRMPTAELEELSQSFVAGNVLPRIYPQLRERLEEHQRRGDFTILNTASPAFYVRHISRVLGFDAYRATEFVVQDPMPLFPRLVTANNKGAMKLKSMADLLPPRVVRDLEDDPLALRTILPGSSAYSDSAADLPLLRLAEEGALVHPTSISLLAEGKKRGWKNLTPPRPYRSRCGQGWGILRQLLGLYPGAGD